MRSVCALVVALLIVGAYAQDNIYSHIVAGKFKRMGAVSVNRLARWDSQAQHWFSPAISKLLGASPAGDGFATNAFTIKDIEVHPSSELVYLLTNDGSNDRIVQYTPSTDSYVALGEEFPSGTVNDLLVTSDKLYICGTFTQSRPVDVNLSPRPVTALDKIAWRSLANTQFSALWTQESPPTNAAASQTIPGCRKLFLFSNGRMMMQSTTNGLVYWRALGGTLEWSSNPQDTFINSQIRAAGTNNVYFGTTYWDGNFLYASYDGAAGGFFTIDGTSNLHQIIRSEDGIVWQPATRLNENWRTTSPFATSFLPSAPFVVHNGEIIYPMLRVNGSRVYYNLHKNVRLTDTGADIIPTRVTPLDWFYGDGDNVGGAPFGAWAKIDGKMIIASSVNEPVYYNEYYFGFSESDANLVTYRRANRLSTIFSIDLATGLPANEYGGGVTGGAVTKIIRSNSSPANNLWFAGSFSFAWNKWALGLAAYNDKRGWVPLGDPLVDFLDWPGEGINAKVAGAAPNKAEYGLTAVHAFQEAGKQYVFIAGGFRRINNATLNGLAWTDTGAINWRPIGNGPGLTDVTNNPLLPGASENSLTLFQRPGRVFSIVSTAGSGSVTKTLWLGGSFSGAGNEVTGLNNIAKVEFSEASSRVFPLAGGVNGNVYAVDAVGKKIFVGGAFNRAGNYTARNIAMWDDTDGQKRWHVLQTGVSGTVRQILALGENNVMVLTDAGAESGGTAPRNNIHWWNGQRWAVMDCEVCKTDCQVRNTLAGCTGVAREIRYVNGRLYRRSDGGALSYFDGQWRSLSETSVSVPFEGDTTADAPRTLIAKGLTGDRVLLGNVQGNNARWSPRLAQISTDLSDNDVYPVATAGGFDSLIVQINSGVSVAPLVALLAAAMFALALLL